MADISFHEFDTREGLADALSDTLVDILNIDFSSGAFASIALSGGSTPKKLLDEMSRKLGANKEMIYFALVDERFVPAGDSRSNEKMIRQQLGLEAHPASEFLSLCDENISAADTAHNAQKKLIEDDELPFDVVTLGMGTDGHTASFFPGGDNLQAATNPDAECLFMPMTAPGATETRITMTLPPIVSAKNLFLHIEGDEKRQVYERALQDGPADEMPIRHILRHPDAKLQVYWAP